jgi:hypothetical protein
MAKGKSLYLFILAACVVGYAYLNLALHTTHKESSSIDFCLVKQTLHIPCPSCGTTRSIVEILHGNVLIAFAINPLGFIVALLMLVLPVWISLDLFRKQQTFLNFYSLMEVYLKKMKFALPLVVLVVLNWIWNISKGL